MERSSVVRPFRHNSTPLPTPLFLPVAFAPYLNEQSTTIIVARQGYSLSAVLSILVFSSLFFRFFVGVVRFYSSCTSLFSYCLSFSTNIVDYIVFLPCTTHPHNGIHCCYSIKEWSANLRWTAANLPL